jgi:hypothetical protein
VPDRTGTAHSRIHQRSGRRDDWREFLQVVSWNFVATV